MRKSLFTIIIALLTNSCLNAQGLYIGLAGGFGKSFILKDKNTEPSYNTIDKGIFINLHTKGRISYELKYSNYSYGRTGFERYVSHSPYNILQTDEMYINNELCFSARYDIIPGFIRKIDIKKGFESTLGLNIAHRQVKYEETWTVEYYSDNSIAKIPGWLSNSRTNDLLLGFNYSIGYSIKRLYIQTICTALAGSTDFDGYRSWLYYPGSRLTLHFSVGYMLN